MNSNNMNNDNNKMYHKTMVQRRRYNKPTWLWWLQIEVEKLGYRIQNGGIVNNFMAPKLHDRRFHEMFGCSSIVYVLLLLLFESFIIYLLQHKTNSYTILLSIFFLSFISQTKINFENCKINDI